ncbi:MAG: coproporphyrinogen-III oxidase family protein [Paludibacteraceae bacterium]|nr:coproporphyrinogen-III oxidase family protein [Paludibacteraceae bacterium]
MPSIYLHIPFCKSRCAYCDFFSTTQLSRREAYVDALCKEAKRRLSTLNSQLSTLNSQPSTLNPISTIYFGGGTPSLLSPDQIARILQAINAPQAIEVTLEANPGDLTPDYLRAIREAGVNRLSIGIQSFDDEVLRRIGRRHTAAEAKAAVKAAQAAGFDNISIDLIYGIPSQLSTLNISPDRSGRTRTLNSQRSTLNTQLLSAWEAQIEQALQLGVQHISTYCLSYEEGTRMTRMLEQGEITEVDEDTENAMYDLLVSQLIKAGFEHYEVSNFALPGYRSRHNSSYWNRTHYIGLGAGAHSYDGARTRSWNPDNLEEYIRAMERGEDAAACETLTDTDLYNERIMLGLRTAEGIALSELHNPALAQPYIERSLLQETADRRLTATISGIHILNRIIEDLME